MYIIYLRPEIIDDEILFYISLKGNTHLKKVSLSIPGDYDISILPMSFPVNNYKVVISGELKDCVIEVFLYLENGNIFSEGFIIEKDQISFADHIYIEKEFNMISQEKMKERKQLAVELLLSDEGFMMDLQEISDDPESLLEKAQEMAEKVAEETLNILDDDEANQYINYNVVAGPESVMKVILGTR